MKRLICILIAVILVFNLAGCSSEGETVKKALTSIAENETVQNWLRQYDVSAVTADAAQKLKESIPILAEFLSREDVKEQFKEVGLPLIEEFLSYNLESMKLKAETLGKIITIFAPELTEQVEEIFQKSENNQK